MRLLYPDFCAPTCEWFMYIFVSVFDSFLNKLAIAIFFKNKTKNNNNNSRILKLSRSKNMMYEIYMYWYSICQQRCFDLCDLIGAAQSDQVETEMKDGYLGNEMVFIQ